MSKITIIAEAGINHCGNMNLVKELASAAKNCGADIFKTKLFSVDKMFPHKKVMVRGKNWYKEVKQTELTRGQLFELVYHCNKIGIEFMASAFDMERLDWLEDVGVRRHKIACRMSKDKAYLREVEATGKDMLISIPYGKMENSALTRCMAPKDWPWKRTTLMYSIPEYPTLLHELKLGQVNWQVYEGFSDHTVGIEASIVALSRGARIIEKHFKLEGQKDSDGIDMVCSITPKEMAELVSFARVVEQVL
jgi:sialic acid synthase SpsE